MRKFEINPVNLSLAGGALIAFVLGIVALTGSTPATPDFREFEAGPERKAAFFSFMRPIVVQQNEELRESRQRLLSLAEEGDIGWLDERWVRELAAEYRIEAETDGGEPLPADVLVERLLLRVDEVPISLALAQAAKESGWGTSRFAREGNNFFGEWCFDEGCGIVPASRGGGKSHEVEAFDSPAESVASYMRNINTHAGYKSFREARKEQRSDDSGLSGVELAEQLTQYSERRDAYVVELKNLIVGNDLDDLEVANASDE